VRKRIVGDGDPLPGRRHHLSRHDSRAEMPKDLQKPYPTFWGGPNWHMIYYPISDWSMFNLGCTVVTGEAKLSEGRGFAPDAGAAVFRRPLRNSDRVLRIPKSFRRFVIVHREPVDNWTTGAATLLGDAAHPDGAIHRPGRGDGAGGCDLPRQRRGRMRRRFRARVSALPDIRIVRTARVQISSMMMSKLNHAKGVERKVRNSLFEGRTAEEFYDRLAWLYTPPPYVK
jgi:salicylate hydroxylase